MLKLQINTYFNSATHLCVLNYSLLLYCGLDPRAILTSNQPFYRRSSMLHYIVNSQCKQYYSVNSKSILSIQSTVDHFDINLINALIFCIIGLMTKMEYIWHCVIFDLKIRYNFVIKQSVPKISTLIKSIY